MGPGKHCVTYRLRYIGRSYIAVVERDDWTTDHGVNAARRKHGRVCRLASGHFENFE